MNGDLLISSVFQALYSSGAIEALPGVIDEAESGNTDVLEPLLGDVFNIYNTISLGMHYSVQCVEEAPFTTEAKVRAAAQPHPRLSLGFISSEPIFDICEAWEVVPAAPKENQPVRSDIRTLVMAGEYDPITPPAWGELAARTLSNSHYYEYPGIGHGASVSDFCPYFMMVDFLDDPRSAPDSSCIAQMGGPDFY
jgi:pimeloyl-ACP methyl ester carboxylesterase